MKSINEMSVLDFQTNDGMIKSDINEIRYLLYVFQKYNEILFGTMWGDLTEEEQDKFKKYLDFIEYFQNKYLYSHHLRNGEKSDFDMMKLMQKKLSELDENDSKNREMVLNLIESYRSDYKEKKAERESLQKELEEVKNEKYSGDFWFR